MVDKDKELIFFCPHWDCGWCYHKEVEKPCQCVGVVNCTLDRGESNG